MNTKQGIIITFMLLLMVAPAMAATTISLVSPANQTTANNQTIHTFIFDATANTTLPCTLNYNNTNVSFNAAVPNNTVTTLTPPEQADGNWTWNVTCDDGVVTNATSINRWLNINAAFTRYEDKGLPINVWMLLAALSILTLVFGLAYAHETDNIMVLMVAFVLLLYSGYSAFSVMLSGAGSTGIVKTTVHMPMVGLLFILLSLLTALITVIKTLDILRE